MSVITELAPFFFLLGLVAFIGYSLWQPFRVRRRVPLKSRAHWKSLNHIILTIWRFVAIIGLIIAAGASGNNTPLCILGLVILGFSICYIKYYKVILSR